MVSAAGGGFFALGLGRGAFFAPRPPRTVTAAPSVRKPAPSAATVSPALSPLRHLLKAVLAQPGLDHALARDAVLQRVAPPCPRDAAPRSARAP